MINCKIKITTYKLFSANNTLLFFCRIVFKIYLPVITYHSIHYFLHIIKKIKKIHISSCVLSIYVINHL